MPDARYVADTAAGTTTCPDESRALTPAMTPARAADRQIRRRAPRQLGAAGKLPRVTAAAA
jgi:hypothetical protein